MAVVHLTGESIGAGPLFDEIVYRGINPHVVLGAGEDRRGRWETIAAPRSSTPPDVLPSGALVVQRALGEGRLGCLRVLGRDVQVRDLYGSDGRIRADVLVLWYRRRPRPQPDATSGWPGSVGNADQPGEWEIPRLPWWPFSRASYFPRRDKSAPGGRAFMRRIAGERRPADWIKREDAIVSQLVAGNMPDALLRWIEIPLAYSDRSRDLSGTIKVLPDYLCVGHEDDFVHVPLDPVSAQRVADTFGVMLPTARICQAVYDHTDPANRLNAIERDYVNAEAHRTTAKPWRAAASTAAYVEHSDAIQSRMHASAIMLGELVAGHKKDVVIARALLADSDRIAYHGFYDSDEFPREPCYENRRHRPRADCDKTNPTLAHSRRFADYSQGVRLVHPKMIVNGHRKRVADVLADDGLCWLISSEGPIAPARIPGTGHPADDEAIE